MNNELLEQQIWEYVDGTMSAEQRPIFEQQLSQDKVLHRSYEEVFNKQSWGISLNVGLMHHL